MATKLALAVLVGGANARLTSLPGFAKPQMGYNSWYDVLMNPSASAVLATADAMKTSGLQAAGYSCAFTPSHSATLRARDGLPLRSPP
jgi:hypothetical protein